jgi:hypothetical protein
VNPEAMASLRVYFEGFWMNALRVFKKTAEEAAKKKR